MSWDSGRRPELAGVKTPQFGVCQRILQTVKLNLHEWLMCDRGGATIAVASEIGKLLLRK